MMVKGADTKPSASWQCVLSGAVHRSRQPPSGSRYEPFDWSDMNGLDLFSGIGGISLALKPWVRTVAYCERDRYAQAVLLSRMASNELDRAPIWDDVTSLNGAMLPSVDIIFGGFPCQDISIAGRGEGLEGKRSGLFFEIIRLTRDIRPRFVFLENVPAITLRGLERVLLEFTSLGYDCRWTTLSAGELGAPHLRKRWFLLASDSDSIGSGDQWQDLVRRNSGMDQRTADAGDDGAEESLADTDSKRRIERNSDARWSGGRDCKKEIKRCGSSNGGGRWITEPDVGRVANGIPFRVDRIRGLGNSVVPLQAREAFKKLMGVE